MNKKRQISVALSALILIGSLAGCSGAVVNTPSEVSSTSEAASDSAASDDNSTTGAEIVITMGHEGNDDLSDGIYSLKFNELLEEKSNGRIQVDYKSNGTLGDEEELLQQVMNGSIQAACISTSTFSNYSDEMDALQLPFLYDSYETESEALKSEQAHALYDAMEKYNVKITDVVEIGFRQFANNVRPITSMEDLSGIKMRIVPSSLLTKVAEAIGMTSTPVSYSEIYSALQSGVIDGEEINLISIVSNSHYEVLKYVSLINFYSFPSAMSFNLDWFNSLSEDDQKLIEECSEEAVAYAMEQTEQIDQDSEKRCEEEGLQINTISDTEKQKFIDACQSIYDEYEKDDLIKAYVDYVRSLQQS